MQLTDKDGNIFGTGGLEITTSSGKPKVPVINTDITIGTTAVVGGVAGRLLYDNAGVVGETAGINWNSTTSTLSLFDSPFYSQAGNSSANTGFSITGTAGSNYTIYSSRQFIFNTGQSMYFNTDTDGGSALDRAWYFAGARSGITGGRTYGALTVDSSGFPSFTLYNNDNGARILLASNTASYFNGGNLLVGTTTDAGFKLDVNGTARVVNQLQVGSFTVGGGASSSIVTQGRISASGGITMYNPAAGDNQDTGIFPIGGVQIKHANSSVATFATVGGATSGTNVAINQGYNPGAGTGSVIGYSHSYALYPSADNTVSYTSYYSRPSWNSSPFYNRITGPIRGFLFSNGLYNTQKLVDVVAFQSDGGRLLFTGDLPAASVTSGISRGLYLNQTHTASANNDVLVGLDIAPTYTNGAFTGLANIDLRTRGTGLVIGSGVGYGALYGYNNDGIIQVVDGGTSAITGFGYATQLWLRPSGNAAGLNSNYWATIEQSTGGLYIQSGRYNSNLYLRTGRTGTSGNIYFNNANGTMGMFFGATANFVINSTTDSGFKFDVNGTARINNIFYITNPSYTGNIRIESIGNNQQRIVGAYGENITWGPDNAIRINSGETYVSGSFLGSGWWMQSNGATVLGAQAAAAASALLDIRSTTRGFLPPRMTTTQKTAIATPATGLQVFDTTLNQMSYYNGTTWINI